MWTLKLRSSKLSPFCSVPSCGTLLFCVLEPCTTHHWIWLRDKTHRFPIWGPILLVPSLSYFGEARLIIKFYLSLSPKMTTLTRVKQWRCNSPDDGADRLYWVGINHYSISSCQKYHRGPTHQSGTRQAFAVSMDWYSTPSTSSSLDHYHQSSIRRHSNSTRA